MDKLRVLYKLLLGCCLMWGAASCAEDDGLSGEEAGETTFTLQIGACPTTVKRAFGGDPEAVQGEFMNSLLVFIVDEQGVVELKIDGATEQSFQDSLAKVGSGNVTYFKKEITLRNGRKTVYAFSNLEGYNGIDATSTPIVNDLQAIGEGQPWPAQVGGYVVDDPAGKLNFYKAGVSGAPLYIPMSAQQETSVPVPGGVIRVELVRLVSKVRARFANDMDEKMTVTDFGIKSFADRVSLMENTRIATAVRSVDKSWNGLSLGVPGGSDVVLPGNGVTEFYVNETLGTAPFEVSLKTGGNAPMDLRGTTARTEIPRNSIYPVALRVTDMKLEVLAYVAPIGGYPVAVTVTGPTLTQSNYYVKLPEDCHFQVNGWFEDRMGNKDNVTEWTWNNDSPGVLVMDNATNGNAITTTLSAHVTALPGQEGTLSFTVSKPRAKSERGLVVATVPLKDGTDYRSAMRRGLPWSAPVEEYELVNLVNK